MKKLLSFLLLLLLGVICTACVNTFAVHELNEIAAKFIQDGDYQSAISRLESANDLDDSVFETRYNLATAYIGVNDCEKALKNVLEAKKIDDKKPSVYYTLAVANDCFVSNRLNNGEIEEETADFQAISNEKAIEYLRNAIENYETYLSMDTHAADAEEVKETIENDKAKMEELEHSEPKTVESY